MKKILATVICLLIMCVLLSGCGSSIKDGEYNVDLAKSEYCNMELVEECDSRVLIYRDIETNVLYLAVGGYSSFGLTPLLNSDGTPKLYKTPDTKETIKE